MKCLVTGAAGFIGSHLCERLLAVGHSVIGLDAFIPFYPRSAKEANLAGLLPGKAFSFLPNLDLRTDPLGQALADVEVIFHLAAMPGLTPKLDRIRPLPGVQPDSHTAAPESRSTGAFPACALRAGVDVTSVYGRYGSRGRITTNATHFALRCDEAGRGESVLGLHADEFGFCRWWCCVFFSVYGPRQRPDMGYHRFIAALEEIVP